MRWIFIILIFPYSLLRAQVVDDFTDGNFNANPTWIGTTDKFQIESNGMLQLFAPASDGEGWLFTQNHSIENAVWQFQIKMGFNPSSANYAKVYLACELNSYPNVGAAFFLVIGTTSDNICLWERKNGVDKKLIEGLTGRLNLSTVDAKVRVSRSANGLFILEVNLDGNWVEEGRYENSIAIESEWVGLSCHYTSTRSALFYFDDFHVSGEPFVDNTLPTITQFEVKNRYGFRLRFSKPVNKLNLNSANFQVFPGGLYPELITVVDDEFALDLNYSRGIPLIDGSALQINGLADIYGNVMSDCEFPYFCQPTELTSIEVVNDRTLKLCFNGSIKNESISLDNFYWHREGPSISSVLFTDQQCITLSLVTDFPNGEEFDLKLHKVVAINGDTIDPGPYSVYRYLAQRNDLVFTEVMADPTPVVNLPDSEYIEIFNRCEFPIKLNNYSLLIGDREVTLGNYTLYPNEYLLLVSSTMTNEWSWVSNKLAVSPWPLLPNTGASIVLHDPSGNVVSSLMYNSNMGASGFKQEGGWSLEIRDPDNLSGDFENWAFSVDEKGGTPCEENSVAEVFPDLEPPVLTGHYLKNDLCVVLEFSEPMSFENLTEFSRFEIDPPSLAISTFKSEDFFLMQKEICFAEQMPESKLFKLKFNTLPVDLAGNPLSGSSLIDFGLPVKANSGDIVINELLYDPPSNGYDYLELYNKSEKIIDLSEIYIARANVDGIPEKLVRLAQEKRMFMPKSYLALSANKNWLFQNYEVYDQQNVMELTDLPNFSTKEGIVFVTDVNGQSLDRFDYHEKMHFALLSDKKGVALERIDVNGNTQQGSNWHSASATSGYGTPGKLNSQAQQTDHEPFVDDFIKLEPDVFYPNQDGVDDLLFIRYSFPEEGNSCTVTIFDSEGRPIRHLINNQLTGVDGFFIWDGLNDKGRRCNTGIYIVWTKSFNAAGKVREVRKVSVLGAGRH